jgi:hypothetical protein
MALGACSGNDDDVDAVDAPLVTPATSSNAVTSTANTTTTEPTTSSPATTTTTTAAPGETGRGLVWESVVDPGRVNTSELRPTFEADGVTSLIDMVVVVPSGSTTELQRWCAHAVIDEQEFDGGEMAQQCVLLQLRFDVAPEFRVDENSPDATVGSASLVSVDGRQVDSISVDRAFGGSVGNRHVVMLPFGGEGATIRWISGSNLVGFTTHTYVVPDLLPSIYFG